MDAIEESASDTTRHWQVLGQKVPKSEVQYFIQMLLIFIIVITSLYNLTVGKSEEGKLWTSLLCSTLGYSLPNPRMRKND